VGAGERANLAGVRPGQAIEFTDYHTAGEPFRIIGAVPAALVKANQLSPDPSAGLPTPPGRNVLERRTWIRQHCDGVRRLLVNEPRGHADMYGGWVVPSDGPDSSGADAVFGVVFFHKDGYSTACGHGSIALGTWALETGLVSPPSPPPDATGCAATPDAVPPAGAEDPPDHARPPGAPDRAGCAATPDAVPPAVEVPFALDVPSGRVHLTGRIVDGLVASVRFRNVPSWVAARGVRVATRLGPVLADISYGGAFYASVRASDLGLTVAPRDLDQLIAVGREIKWALDTHPAVAHPADVRLSGCYGTIWWEPAEPSGAAQPAPLPGSTGVVTGGAGAAPLGAIPPGLGSLQAAAGIGGAARLGQRNVTIFADGEVDRSPCGSGTSARLALLAADGLVGEGRELDHWSIIGTRFIGRVLGAGAPVARDGELVPTVATEVEGRASHTMTGAAILAPNDEVGLGFQLR
jgi:proline racemase